MEHQELEPLGDSLHPWPVLDEADGDDEDDEYKVDNDTDGEDTESEEADEHEAHPQEEANFQLLYIGDDVLADIEEKLLSDSECVESDAEDDDEETTNADPVPQKRPSTGAECDSAAVSREPRQRLTRGAGHPERRAKQQPLQQAAQDARGLSAAADNDLDGRPGGPPPAWPQNGYHQNSRWGSQGSAQHGGHGGDWGSTGKAGVGGAAGPNQRVGDVGPAFGPYGGAGGGTRANGPQGFRNEDLQPAGPCPGAQYQVAASLTRQQLPQQLPPGAQLPMGQATQPPCGFVTNAGAQLKPAPPPTYQPPVQLHHLQQPYPQQQPQHQYQYRQEQPMQAMAQNPAPFRSLSSADTAACPPSGGICRRTRAHVSLRDVDMAELEQQLPEHVDMEEIELAEDDEEYGKFLQSLFDETAALPEDCSDEDPDFGADLDLDLEDGSHVDGAWLQLLNAEEKNGERNAAAPGDVPVDSPARRTRARSKRNNASNAGAAVAAVRVVDAPPEGPLHMTPDQLSTLHAQLHCHSQMLVQLWSLLLPDQDPEAQNLAGKAKQMLDQLVAARDVQSVVRQTAGLPPYSPELLALPAPPAPLVPPPSVLHISAIAAGAAEVAPATAPAATGRAAGQENGGRARQQRATAAAPAPAAAANAVNTGAYGPFDGDDAGGAGGGDFDAELGTAGFPSFNMPAFKAAAAARSTALGAAIRAFRPTWWPGPDGQVWSILDVVPLRKLPEVQAVLHIMPPLPHSTFERQKELQSVAKDRRKTKRRRGDDPLLPALEWTKPALHCLQGHLAAALIYSPSAPVPTSYWTNAEDELMIYGLQKYGTNWRAISEALLVTRSHAQVANRYKNMNARSRPAEQAVAVLTASGTGPGAGASGQGQGQGAQAKAAAGPSGAGAGPAVVAATGAPGSQRRPGQATPGAAAANPQRLGGTGASAGAAAAVTQPGMAPDVIVAANAARLAGLPPAMAAAQLFQAQHQQQQVLRPPQPVADPGPPLPLALPLALPPPPMPPSRSAAPQVPMSLAVQLIAQVQAGGPDAATARWIATQLQDPTTAPAAITALELAAAQQTAMQAGADGQLGGPGAPPSSCSASLVAMAARLLQGGGLGPGGAPAVHQHGLQHQPTAPVFPTAPAMVPVAGSQLLLGAVAPPPLPLPPSLSAFPPTQLQPAVPTAATAAVGPGSGPLAGYGLAFPPGTAAAVPGMAQQPFAGPVPPVPAVGGAPHALSMWQDGNHYQHLAQHDQHGPQLPHHHHHHHHHHVSSNGGPHAHDAAVAAGWHAAVQPYPPPPLPPPSSPNYAEMEDEDDQDDPMHAMDFDDADVPGDLEPGSEPEPAHGGTGLAGPAAVGAVGPATDAGAAGTTGLHPGGGQGTDLAVAAGATGGAAGPTDPRLGPGREPHVHHLPGQTNAAPGTAPDPHHKHQHHHHLPPRPPNSAGRQGTFVGECSPPGSHRGLQPTPHADMPTTSDTFTLGGLSDLLGPAGLRSGAATPATCLSPQGGVPSTFSHGHTMSLLLGSGLGLASLLQEGGAGVSAGGGSPTKSAAAGPAKATATDEPQEADDRHDTAPGPPAAAAAGGHDATAVPPAPATAGTAAARAPQSPKPPAPAGPATGLLSPMSPPAAGGSRWQRAAALRSAADVTPSSDPKAKRRSRIGAAALADAERRAPLAIAQPLNDDDSRPSPFEGTAQNDHREGRRLRTRGQHLQRQLRAGEGAATAAQAAEVAARGGPGAGVCEDDGTRAVAEAVRSPDSGQCRDNDDPGAAEGLARARKRLRLDPDGEEATAGTGDTGPSGTAGPKAGIGARTRSSKHGGLQEPVSTRQGRSGSSDSGVRAEAVAAAGAGRGGAAGATSSDVRERLAADAGAGEAPSACEAGSSGQQHAPGATPPGRKASSGARAASDSTLGDQAAVDGGAHGGEASPGQAVQQTSNATGSSGGSGSSKRRPAATTAGQLQGASTKRTRSSRGKGAGSQDEAPAPPQAPAAAEAVGAAAKEPPAAPAQAGRVSGQKRSRAGSGKQAAAAAAAATAAATAAAVEPAPPSAEVPAAVGPLAIVDANTDATAADSKVGPPGPGHGSDGPSAVAGVSAMGGKQLAGRGQGATPHSGGARAKGTGGGKPGPAAAGTAPRGEEAAGAGAKLRSAGAQSASRPPKAPAQRRAAAAGPATQRLTRAAAAAAAAGAPMAAGLQPPPGAPPPQPTAEQPPVPRAAQAAGVSGAAGPQTDVQNDALTGTMAASAAATPAVAALPAATEVSLGGRTSLHSLLCGGDTLGGALDIISFLPSISTRSMAAVMADDVSPQGPRPHGPQLPGAGRDAAEGVPPGAAAGGANTSGGVPDSATASAAAHPGAARGSGGGGMPGDFVSPSHSQLLQVTPYAPSGCTLRTLDILPLFSNTTDLWQSLHEGSTCGAGGGGMHAAARGSAARATAGTTAGAAGTTAGPGGDTPMDPWTRFMTAASPAATLAAAELGQLQHGATDRPQGAAGVAGSAAGRCPGRGSGEAGAGWAVKAAAAVATTTADEDADQLAATCQAKGAEDRRLHHDDNTDRRVEGLAARPAAEAPSPPGAAAAITAAAPPPAAGKPPSDAPGGALAGAEVAAQPPAGPSHVARPSGADAAVPQKPPRPQPPPGACGPFSPPGAGQLAFPPPGFPRHGPAPSLAPSLAPHVVPETVRLFGRPMAKPVPITSPTMPATAPLLRAARVAAPPPPLPHLPWPGAEHEPAAAAAKPAMPVEDAGVAPPGEDNSNGSREGEACPDGRPQSAAAGGMLPPVQTPAHHGTAGALAAAAQRPALLATPLERAAAAGGAEPADASPGTGAGTFETPMPGPTPAPTPLVTLGNGGRFLQHTPVCASAFGRGPNGVHQPDGLQTGGAALDVPLSLTPMPPGDLVAPDATVAKPMGRMASRGTAWDARRYHHHHHHHGFGDCAAGGRDGAAQPAPSMSHWASHEPSPGSQTRPGTRGAAIAPERELDLDAEAEAHADAAGGSGQGARGFAAACDGGRRPPRALALAAAYTPGCVSQVARRGPSVPQQLTPAEDQSPSVAQQLLRVDSGDGDVAGGGGEPLPEDEEPPQGDPVGVDDEGLRGRDLGQGQEAVMEGEDAGDGPWHAPADDGVTPTAGAAAGGGGGAFSGGMAADEGLEGEAAAGAAAEGTEGDGEGAGGHAPVECATVVAPSWTKEQDQLVMREIFRLGQGPATWQAIWEQLGGAWSVEAVELRAKQLMARMFALM